MSFRAMPAVRYGRPIFAVHGLCRALAARGHELQVFTTNIDGAGITPTPIGKSVDVDDVQIQYFSCPLLRPTAACFVPGQAHVEEGSR
jgi:hypothetical protein